MTRPRGRPRDTVECIGCDAKIDAALAGGTMETGPLCPKCVKERHDAGGDEGDEDEGDDVEELEFDDDRELDFGGEEDEG